MVEAVTARVSVLPVVGSELPTSLSAAVGVTEQLVVDLGDTLDKVGHGAGQSCVRIVPAECLPGLREVRDIMFSWIWPVAVLTSQFFLSDENGEVDMPSRRNGGSAPLRQEVDFDSLHICPQKMGHAETAGPAVDRWDWRRILGNVVRFSRLPDIPKLADRNGFRNLDRKYGLNLCVITVQSSIQPLRSGLVTYSYPQLESHGGTSNPDDRQIGRYDDSDWSRENPNRAFGKEVSRTGMTCAEYCPYIKVTSLNDWAVSNRPAVEPIVFRSPHILVWDARDEDITWIRLAYFWFHNCLVWWIAMSSSNIMPEADRPSAVDTDSTQPPGTFLRHVLKSHSDRQYDLPEDITDVMGLQALRPCAEVCKVMTVPNSGCVRVVTPDEHVSTGFHEILIHDMVQEDWPLVTLSDIGCLRLDWPRDLFTFVERYQCELEQMRKTCRECFGPTASGTCPTCERYIQVNLGKHVVLYHLDLAQLWRCPVPWCTVWKGKSQDCVDHMRKAHDTPVFVKAGILA